MQLSFAFFNILHLYLGERKLCNLGRQCQVLDWVKAARASYKIKKEEMQRSKTTQIDDRSNSCFFSLAMTWVFPGLHLSAFHWNWLQERRRLRQAEMAEQEDPV